MARLSGSEWITTVYDFMFGPQAKTPELDTAQAANVDTYLAIGAIRSETAMTQQATRQALEKRASMGKWTAFAFVGGLSLVGIMLLTGKK